MLLCFTCMAWVVSKMSTITDLRTVIDGDYISMIAALQAASSKHSHYASSEFQQTEQEACVQATSKKRERQVGEAQGALVIAEAHIGGLKQQIQDLTAANKQASILRQTFDPHCHNQPLHRVIAIESLLP